MPEHSVSRLRCHLGKEIPRATGSHISIELSLSVKQFGKTKNEAHKIHNSDYFPHS